MKQGGLLKSVRIRKGKTTLKTGTIKRKSKRNSPPIPRRNFGIFLRGVHRVEDLKEEVRKETNLTEISKILNKR